MFWIVFLSENYSKNTRFPVRFCCFQIFPPPGRGVVIKNTSLLFVVFIWKKNKKHASSRRGLNINPPILLQIKVYIGVSEKILKICKIDWVYVTLSIYNVFRKFRKFRVYITLYILVHPCTAHYSLTRIPLELCRPCG